MSDYAFRMGKADGEHDAKAATWLDRLAGTLDWTPVNVEEPDRTQYLAGYLVGMTDRLRELATMCSACGFERDSRACREIHGHTAAEREEVQS